MKVRIPEKLRQQVAQRARFCCEYCRIPEAFLATFFHIDHVRSRKHGGKTDADNLAYACPHCNQNKGSDIATFTSDNADDLIRFYNPRSDHWHEHFETEAGEIIPKTPIGIATAKILDFNQPERLILRQALARIQQYPKPD
jgi:HNH endonuclease